MMTLRKLEDNKIQKMEHYIALSGQLALEEAMDLSWDIMWWFPIYAMFLRNGLFHLLKFTYCSQTLSRVQVFKHTQYLSTWAQDGHLQVWRHQILTSWWWAHSARNVKRRIINLLQNKNLCIKLVSSQDYTEMHGQQDIKIRNLRFSLSTKVQVSNCKTTYIFTTCVF